MYSTTIAITASCCVCRAVVCENQRAGQQGRVGPGPGAPRPPDQYRRNAVRQPGGPGHARPERVHAPSPGRPEGRLVRGQLSAAPRSDRRVGDARPRGHGPAPDRQFVTARRVRRARGCHDRRGPDSTQVRARSESAQQSGIVSTRLYSIIQCDENNDGL